MSEPITKQHKTIDSAVVIIDDDDWKTKGLCRFHRQPSTVGRLSTLKEHNTQILRRRPHIGLFYMTGPVVMFLWLVLLVKL
jgi:hypothetical protein